MGLVRRYWQSRRRRALLFMGEYWFRRWRFPQYRHASPLALAAIVAARGKPEEAAERARFSSFRSDSVLAWRGSSA
jgi:hypothetical protein